MYKLFINENSVFFTDINLGVEGFQTVWFQEIDFQKLWQQLAVSNAAKINIICKNLSEDWKTFLLNFEIREAAGGVVFNNQRELLWIYRFDKWDLPKGHIEQGESKEIAAIREVEEECGLNNLSIVKELLTTFHVFEHKGKKILKKTYWFLMDCNLEAFDLKPQLEEGIEQVVFKDKSASKDCLNNTYQNIKILLSEIL